MIEIIIRHEEPEEGMLFPPRREKWKGKRVRSDVKIKPQNYAEYAEPHPNRTKVLNGNIPKS